MQKQSSAESIGVAGLGYCKSEGITRNFKFIHDLKCAALLLSQLK